MENEAIIATLVDYKKRLENILARYSHSSNGLYMAQDDMRPYRQIVNELIDFLLDCLGDNRYSIEIADQFNRGFRNYIGAPSYRSVENIIATLDALITRLTRNPEILDRKKASEQTIRKENVFIIHGSDEAKWREFKDIVKNQFRLNPIVLMDKPDAGCKTVTEKFELYAQQCAYAIAVFTPDDEVTSSDVPYLQARPNVIYELGWFCGKLGRSSVMLLLREGTSLFSDFGGILQKRFSKNVAEKTDEIKRDLIAAGIMDDV